MTIFDLHPIFDSMIEWPPHHLHSDESNRDGYTKLGVSLEKNKGLSVKLDKISELFKYLWTKLSDMKLQFTENFMREVTRDFLIKSYPDKSNKTINDLLNAFKMIKPRKVNVYVKIFNLQIDTQKYDGESFSLFNPQYFIKTYDNPMMYLRIKDTESVNEDNLIHSGLVIKDIGVFQEDKDGVILIIQEKTEEFINAIGIALGDKDGTQRLSTSFNSIGMEYHILNKDMLETNSSFSLNGSTFTRGTIDLKTELFFKHNGSIFNLLHRRENALHEKVYKSVLWLGKSLQTENIGDSFLQVAISLECLLTRQEKGIINPSITHSISEALAFLIGNTKAERMNHICEIKRLYALRSSIVHSGKEKITLQSYYEFFNLVKLGIYKILELAEEKKFNHINNIYNYIDCLKFG